jgi:hypothetical protein
MKDFKNIKSVIVKEMNDIRSYRVGLRKTGDKEHYQEIDEELIKLYDYLNKCDETMEYIEIIESERLEKEKNNA